MSKCKFDLTIPITGMNVATYTLIKLGDKFAKISDIREETDEYDIILLSKHKNRDFLMEIESRWKLSKGKNIFKITGATIELQPFDILQEIYVLPESHLNTLKKWFDERF